MPRVLLFFNDVKIGENIFLNKKSGSVFGFDFCGCNFKVKKKAHYYIEYR